MALLRDSNVQPVLILHILDSTYDFLDLIFLIMSFES